MDSSVDWSYIDWSEREDPSLESSQTEKQRESRMKEAEQNTQTCGITLKDMMGQQEACRTNRKHVRSQRIF
jgi:hypothetical protein